MAVVQLGRQRAARHGWRSEQTVYLYLSLMLMLGSGFESDPLLPWTARALQREPRRDAVPRMFALHAEALDRLDEIVGERNEHLCKALLRLRGLDLAGFDTPDLGAGAATLRQCMADLYPQKASAAGADGLEAWAALALARARQHGLQRPRDVALLAGLMFMMGCEVDTDPAWPWVAAALAMPLPGPQRAALLHQSALAQIERSLAPRGA